MCNCHISRNKTKCSYSRNFGLKESWKSDLPIASSHQKVSDVILKDIVCWRPSETSLLHIEAQVFGKNQIKDVALPSTLR